ncbi:MAG: 3-dehydroquinate synthase [Candidatus Omnitrophica bacterium CG1_02_49_10]|nr:MAG: 3-dehydroquinate synthase [Candidatus Omnitrophica bacterium CG1_02_49_10]
MLKKIHLDLGRNSYNIYIDTGIIKKAGRYIKNLCSNDSVAVITNRKIYSVCGSGLTRSLAASGLKYKVFTVPDAETSKSLKEVERLNTAITRSFTARHPVVVALGGGVVGDLAGFVASICKRGLPLIQIPTTLLAQLDSSIGGKVGIDTSSGKNLMGAFYQPKAVLIDPDVIRSLPPRQIRCGLAEAIKCAVITDNGLFAYIGRYHKKLLNASPASLGYVVKKCAAIKASIVERDEFDKLGIRAKLNFGHTIGHAIESAASYKRYLHGEAISIGMLSAADIAVEMGLFKGGERDRLEKLIRDVGLPVKIKGIRLDSILCSVSYDKKFSDGRSRFILPVSIGRVRLVDNVAAALIKKVVAYRMA